MHELLLLDGGRVVHLLRLHLLLLLLEVLVLHLQLVLLLLLLRLRRRRGTARMSSRSRVPRTVGALVCVLQTLVLPARK